MDSYTPLHVHFYSSYLDGAIRYDDLSILKERGFNACAITDHGNLSGVYEFVKTARKNNIKPIVGIETYWAFDRKLKGKDELGSARPSYHMILFARDNIGLKSLNRINSLSWKEGFYFSPRADNEVLSANLEGVMATSACLGSISSQYFLRGEYNKAIYWLTYFKELFNGNFFLELQPHPDMEEQRQVNSLLLKASKEIDAPIIVTGDSHYLDCCDSSYHDHLLCVSMNKKLDDPTRMRFTWDASIPTYSDLVKRCSDSDIPEEAISNTRYVSNLVTDDYFSDVMNRWPTFKKLPLEFPNTYEFLVSECLRGYKVRYGGAAMTQEHKERINEELRVLKIMGYIDYMLILADILNHSRENKILVGMGRGSAGGSFVAYLLGITDVDPFKFGLLFSRFCNEGRAATPFILDGDNL